MADKLQITIVSRSGKQLASLSQSKNSRVSHLKASFQQLFPKYGPERQFFTIDTARGEALKDDKMKLDELAADEVKLVFKDLGPQISWRLVYFIEYLGPLVIFPIFFYYPEWVWGRSADRSRTQLLAFYMLMFHFVKREMETIAIHRFSNATMPVTRLWLNCLYYWGLCAGLISYFLFHPDVPESGNPPVHDLMYASLFLMFETLNFNTHIILRNLRPQGTKERKIPRGAGFGLVSCANYMWELCAWGTFALFSECFAVYIFLATATMVLVKWAQERHRRYLKEFDGRGGRPKYPAGRSALIPFIL